MDCKTLEKRFEALLEGTLDAAERDTCNQHLENCPLCSDLVEFADDLVGPNLDPADYRPPADLVNSVLIETSGPTCEPARWLITGLVDGTLTGTDRLLVQTHMEECLECSELGSICLHLQQDLPLLAELHPDSSLVDDVLAATLPASTKMRRWWSVTWPQTLLRPRFALEAAYIGTLVLLLVLNASGRSLEAMPQKALAVTHSHPIARLRDPVSALEHRVVAKIRPAWISTRDQTVAKLDRATERSRGLLTAVVDQGGTLWNALASFLERPYAQVPSGSNESTKETQS